jgi:hypothetical protein
MVKKKVNKYSNRNFYLVIGACSIALLALLLLFFKLSSDGTIAGEAFYFPAADWCYDTDGGIDIFTQGHITSYSDENGNITRMDLCRPNGKLVEYKCATGNRIKGIVVNCAVQGMTCSTGECV